MSYSYGVSTTYFFKTNSTARDSSVVFSVTPFEIDQSPESGKRKNVDMQRLRPPRLAKIQVTTGFLKRDMRRNLLPKFIEICLETPCWWPSRLGFRISTQTSVICQSVLLRKREFISRGTQKRWNNTFSNTLTVQMAQFPEINHLLNQHDSSLGRHVCHVNATSSKA